MKWLMASKTNSIFARRISKMFELPFSVEFKSEYDGVIYLEITRQTLDEIETLDKNLPKIIYWTGGDARMYIDANRPQPTDFGKEVRHITDSPWLVSLLHSKGIPTIFVPLPISLPEEVEFPKKPGLLLYVTGHIQQDLKRIKHVIRCVRNIPIYVMSIDAGENPKVQSLVNYQENVTVFTSFIEEEERSKIFEKVSVYLRLMKADGLSNLVVEMKYLGRQVFYNIPTPYCNLVLPDNKPEKIAAKIREAFYRDNEGAEWYKSIFSREKFLTTMKNICKREGWNFG